MWCVYIIISRAVFPFVRSFFFYFDFLLLCRIGFVFSDLFGVAFLFLPFHSSSSSSFFLFVRFTFTSCIFCYCCCWWGWFDFIEAFRCCFHLFRSYSLLFFFCFRSLSTLHHKCLLNKTLATTATTKIKEKKNIMKADAYTRSYLWICILVVVVVIRSYNLSWRHFFLFLSLSFIICISSYSCSTFNSKRNNKNNNKQTERKRSWH